MTSKQIADLEHCLARFIKEQTEDECGCLHANPDEEEVAWTRDFELNTKSLELVFSYDITFTGEFVKGKLKIPKEYPSGDYLLTRGFDKPYVCDSGNNLYETLVLVFRQFDRERLGESTLPTPTGQDGKRDEPQWDDIHTQIFSDEYTVWLNSAKSAKIRGNVKKSVIEFIEVDQMHRLCKFKILGALDTEWIPFDLFYGKDYLEDFGDQSIRLVSEDVNLVVFVDFINSWIVNHFGNGKAGVHSVLEKCSDVYQEAKKRAMRNQLAKTPWFERVDDEDREAESFFRTVWTPILGNSAVQKDVLGAIDAKHAIIKQLELIKAADTKSMGFEVRAFGQNVYRWQIKMLGFEKDYPQLAKDLKRFSEMYKEGNEIIVEALFPSDYPDSPPFLRICSPRLKYLTGNTRYDGTFTHIPALALYSKHVDMLSLLKAIRQTLINGAAKIDLSTNWGYDKISAGRTYLRESRNKFSSEGKYGGKFTVTTLDTARSLGGFIEPYHDIENGNNILLPINARDQIQLPLPLMIEYKTPEGEISYCGVLDFSLAQNNRVVFPQWMMKHSCIHNGDTIEIRFVKLPRPNAKEGHSVKIQPHSKEFYKMQGGDIALAQRLSNFTTLAENQTVPVTDLNTGKEHLVQITRTSPAHAICIKVGHGEEFDLLYDVLSPYDEVLKKKEVDEFDETEEDEETVEEDLDPIENFLDRKPKPKKDLPKFHKSEKPVLGEGEVECDNCHKPVKKANQIHFVQCARINFSCKKCLAVIKNDPEEKKKHESEFHSLVKCKCGQEMDKWKLPEHEWSECPDRLVECSICFEDLKAGEIEKHEKECSEVNRPCAKCRIGIKTKELKSHFDICQGPPKKQKKNRKNESIGSGEILHEIQTDAPDPIIKDMNIIKDKETKKGGLFDWLKKPFGQKTDKKDPKEVKFTPTEPEIRITPKHTEQTDEFTCSLCGFPGMSKDQFVEHLFAQHGSDSSAQIIINSLLN